MDVDVVVSLVPLVVHSRVGAFKMGEIIPTEGQGLAKRRSPGLVNFAAAVAYHFYLALPAAFTQPGEHLLAEPCKTTI